MCLCPSASECPVGCELCVRSNMCARCRADLYFLHGQCHITCPRGFEPDVQLMQCIPQGKRYFNNNPHAFDISYTYNHKEHLCIVSICIHTVLCFHFLPLVSVYLIISSSHFIVDCEVGEWTEWGPCIRKRSTRAYRKGKETRTRQVLHAPSIYGDPCPHLSEIRKCVIKKRQSQNRLW